MRLSGVRDNSQGQLQWGCSKRYENHLGDGEPGWQKSQETLGVPPKPYEWHSTGRVGWGP